MKIAPIALEFAGGLALITKTPKSLYTVLPILIKQRYLENFHNTSGLNYNERGETSDATVIWVLEKLRKQVNKNILSEKVGGV